MNYDLYSRFAGANIDFPSTSGGVFVLPTPLFVNLNINTEIAPSIANGIAFRKFLLAFNLTILNFINQRLVL